MPSNTRDSLRRYLTKKNINTAIYYPNTIMDNAPYKKFCTKKNLKNSFFLKKNILALPFDAYIKEKSIKFICKQIENFYKKKLYS